MKKLNPDYRAAILLAITYALFFPICWLLEKWSPSGPCTPGLGMLLLACGMITIPVFFVISLVYAIRGRKKHFGLLFVHGLVLLVWTLAGLWK